MSDPVYGLRNVVKAYAQREVLHIDELEIYRGEIFSILGPNGAGKSTLLRLLNFLEPPTSGQIAFNGHPVDDIVSLEIRRQVTTVFQRPILLNASVQWNVAYGLWIRGERETDSRVNEALAQVGLRDFARAPARTLSGGEAQRVTLARAMVVEPEVLLLDEPTANLDPHNAGLIEGIVAGLNREREMTIVLVTQNVFQAKRLAHRGALLLEGRAIEVGEARRFFEAPRDPRTAAFVRGETVY